MSHLGRGRGSESTHPQDILDLVRDLAFLSGRGRPWQSVGIALIDAGWVIDDDELLQALATWLMDMGSARLRALAAAASRDGLISAEELRLPDPHAAIAAGLVHRHRTTRSMRPLLRRAREAARVDHTYANRLELSQLATDYLTATIAERLGSDTLMAHAVLPGTQSPHAMSDAGTDRPTIDMRSMEACASTLTAVEVKMLWEPIAQTLAELQGPDPDERDLSMLYLIVRTLTEARIGWHGDVNQPMDPADISDVLGLPADGKRT